MGGADGFEAAYLVLRHLRMSKRWWCPSVIHVWWLAIGVLINPLRRRERAVGRRLWLLLRWKRLAVSAVEHHPITRISPSTTGTTLVLSIAQVRIGSVRWNERLRL